MALNRITASGTPFEIGFVEHGGVPLRIYSRAPATLPALFDHYCALHDTAEFIVDGDVRLTFAEVHALARRTAAGLITRYGVRRGDRVGIAARNSANWIIAYMGVLMAGGCVTMLNGWWSGEELAGGIALAECAVVLADVPRAARLAAHPIAARLVAFDHGKPEAGLAGLLGSADDHWRLPEVTGEDLATLVFTSGSTGTAKGAVSDHRAVVQATINFAVQSLALFAAQSPGQSPVGTSPPAQSALLSVPLFHVTGKIALFLQSFVSARRLVIMPQWDAREAMRLIAREGITFFAGVPLMILEMADHPARREYDISTCATFVAGGAPRPVEHIDRLQESLPGGAHLLGYGLTETNCTGCCNMAENYLAKPGSTGPASQPLVEIAVFGPDGAPLPAGLRGEVGVRSICNFAGYWRNPEETAASLRPDGYFLTGDLGYLDEDGYLFIVDRKKDIIIRGGENIASAEVEHAIYAHPGVAEASVFGLPHAHYGEVPVAVYSIKDGHRLSEKELREHLTARIAAFKIPVRLWLEEAALPRLGAAKIDKQRLKARYSQSWEDAKAAL